MKRLLMKGLLAALGVSLCGLLMGMASGNSTGSPAPTKVTFNKDVLPILQNNCQSCHRPGEVAPMALMTYSQVRPWATAIKTAVLVKKMPPWLADPQYGHFENERKLTPEQIKTLVSWADSGAVEGDAKDKPAPIEFVDGWNIGKPDRIIEMPAQFHIPAQGTIEYQYVVIPGGFTEDTWVKAAEVRPGNRALVHHVIAFVRPPGAKWLKDAQPGVPFVPTKEENSDRRRRRSDDGSVVESENLVGYAPGLQPLELHDSAKLVKAGSDIVLQLHYTANGTAGDDKTKVGFIFSKEAPKLRNVTLLAPNNGFVIPPGADNYEVKSQVELQDTVQLVDLMPHMHFRGKDFTYKITYPDGQSETVLSVPKYDFNWQLGYMLQKPITLPKGTRIECTAHFDNSANNLYNPDPTKEVRWGGQTWEEMMIGWFSVAVDPKVSVAGLVKFERPGTTSQPKAAPAGPAVGASGASSSSR